MKLRSSPQSQNQAKQCLKKHGRSFYFASLFLSPRQAAQAARLYSFCRYLDDLVDEPEIPREDRDKKLHQISSDLKRSVGTSKATKDFLDLARQEGIDTHAALYMVEGVSQDRGDIILKTRAELIQYCYKVAGTVGVMMCPILGVRDDRAYAHAIDMGMAMQLTNIARDVEEDAQKGRRYIPSSLSGEIPPSLICDPDAETRLKISKAVKAILDIAEQYYLSGFHGLKYLPPRPRLAILIAARVYKEIGEKIRSCDCDIWAGRSYVPALTKAGLSCLSLKEFVVTRGCHQDTRPHSSELHLNIQDYPGTHANPKRKVAV